MRFFIKIIGAWAVESFTSRSFAFTLFALTFIGPLNSEQVLVDPSLRLRFWKPQASSLAPSPKTTQFSSRFHKAIDQTHLALGHRFVNSARWFDRYFNRDEQLSIPNESYFRLNTAMRRIQGDGFSPQLQFKARFHLPYFKRRFKLVVDSASESLLNEEFLGKSSTEQELDRNNDKNYSLSTALRWSIFNNLKHHWVVDSGVKIKLPMKAYLRTEYQYIKHLRYGWSLLFNQKLFAVINDESGSASLLEFSHPISDNRLLKFHHHFRLTDETDDLEFTHGLTMYQSLGRANRAISYGGHFYGRTDPKVEHIGWSIYSQYRQNIFRPWMFFYFEPSISYPREEQWKAQHHFTVGFESYFGKIFK
jgi:hypothetical protein